MKKLMLLLLAACLLLTFAGCSAESEENKDSREEDHIEALAEYSTAKETIGVAAYQKLIGYYRLPLASLFADSDSIEEILISEYVYNIYYLVEQYGKIVGSYVYEDGKISCIVGHPPKAETDPGLLNSIFSEQLPDNAEMLDVYHLDGEANHNGHALYVRTTAGDFVYYDYYLTYEVLGKEQTFFTASEFFDLMKAVDKRNKEAWGYTDERKWLPIVIGFGIAFVAAGGATWFLLHNKKKKAKENVSSEVSAQETNL